MRHQKSYLIFRGCGKVIGATLQIQDRKDRRRRVQSGAEMAGTAGYSATTIAAIRRQPFALSELAQTLKRDRAAVDRDFKVLVALGLVKTVWQSNPGHGRKKIVQPLLVNMNSLP